MKVSTALRLRITMHKARSHFSFNPLQDSRSCRDSKSCTHSFNLSATACNEKANWLLTISGQQQSLLQFSHGRDLNVQIRVTALAGGI